MTCTDVVRKDRRAAAHFGCGPAVRGIERGQLFVLGYASLALIG
jgi:hypothetical protein